METQLWREMLDPYRLAVDELVVKFTHVKQEYQDARMYSPIESVSGRVKRISSILDKAHRKGIDIEDIEEKIEDIAGVRIICQFVEDIDTVVDIIRKRSDMIVKREKDYITQSKPSGYRSYHIIVYYTVQTIKGPKNIEAEIQIRTLAMNFWSTIEHSLLYKYKENMHAQNSNRQKANIITNILNNIENLYHIANEREVTKIQNEFFDIYKKDDMALLKRFNKQLDMLSETYHAQSIQSVAGRFMDL